MPKPPLLSQALNNSAVKKQEPMQEYRYGIPIKSAKEVGLDAWFKNNTETSGMVWGNGINGSSPDTPLSIVINPYSENMKNPANRESLYKNEAARILMSQSPVPKYPITPQLQKWREATFTKGQPYLTNDDMFRETVIARIMAGDPGPDKKNPMPADKDAAALAAKYNKMLSEMGAQKKPKTITEGINSALEMKGNPMK
jgi:hypothetical protein